MRNLFVDLFVHLLDENNAIQYITSCLCLFISSCRQIMLKK